MKNYLILSLIFFSIHLHAQTSIVVKESFDDNKLNWTMNRSEGKVPEIKDGACKINTQNYKEGTNVMYPNKDLAISSFDRLKIHTKFKTSNIEGAIGIACVSKNGEHTSALSFLINSTGYSVVGEVIESMQYHYFDKADFSEKLTSNEWIDLVVIIDNKKSIIEFLINSKIVKTTEMQNKAVSKIDNIGFLLQGNQAVEIDFFEVEKKEGGVEEKGDLFLFIDDFLTQRSDLNDRLPIDVVDMVGVTGGRTLDVENFLVETMVDTKGVDYVEKAVRKDYGTVYFFLYQKRKFGLRFSIPDESKGEIEKDLIGFSVSFGNKADAKKFVEDLANYLGWIFQEGTDGYHHPKSMSARIWWEDDGFVNSVF